MTGAAGFIGSHFVRELLAGSYGPDVTGVTVYDKLTYAGNLDNLAAVHGDPRFSFVRGDIFDGDLLAVHPEATELLGVTSVPNLRQSPWPVDLAIVAVPAEAVPGVLEDAAAAGVIGLVVVSGGFADSGADGIRRQRSLVEAARLLGVRIVGPNALGMVNTDPSIRMNASLVPALPSAGKVGFFCQSGALGSSILRRLESRGLGVSTFVSAGNRRSKGWASK